MPPHPRIPAPMLRALEDANGAPLRYTPGRAVPTRCTRCGRMTLAGWDDTSLAGWAVLDPVHLTLAQEIACWDILKITTYEIFGSPGHYTFGAIRTAKWMRIPLMPEPIGYVLPAHTCKPPPSADRIPLAPPAEIQPDTPPF